MAPRAKRILQAAAAAALLAAAFAAYLTPTFLLDLATRFVLC